MTPTVYIVRHGSTSMNQHGSSDRLKGTRFDVPLDAKGREEAKKSASALDGIDIASIKHSPLKRSAQTARAISQATGIESTADKALHPWDVGFMSGQKRDKFKGILEWYIEHPSTVPRDGESYGDWFERFSCALASELAAASRDDGARVLVSHSCGLLAAEAVVNGTDPKAHVGTEMARPGNIMRISKSGGKWRIGWLDS